MTLNMLVADDDEGIREMFEDIPPAGAKIKTVEDGKQLVDHYFQNREYVLIITDKDMPVGGLVAIRAIRKFDTSVEIWMMSGDKNVEATKALAFDAGANRYYEKNSSGQIFQDAETFVRDYEAKQKVKK
jgi:CheY-like chemotaxis protein